MTLKTAPLWGTVLPQAGAADTSVVPGVLLLYCFQFSMRLTIFYNCLSVCVITVSLLVSSLLIRLYVNVNLDHFCSAKVCCVIALVKLNSGEPSCYLTDKFD